MKISKHLVAEQSVFTKKADTSELVSQFFSGNSYLQNLVNDSKINLGVANVIQEPGSRTNWHIHKNGYQILIATKGRGHYQEKGKAVQKLEAGEVVVTYQDIEHWHGAAADEWFEYIAITNGNVEWLETADKENICNFRAIQF